MLFKEVIGQSDIKRRLINDANEGRIAHALLFSGTQGVGKLPIALAYSQYICCQNRKEDDSCGVCPSCVKFKKLVHPDLHFVLPTVKKSTSDSVLNKWRSLVTSSPYFTYDQWLDAIDAENAQATIYTAEADSITRKLSLKSNEGGYKIAIIWQAEKMRLEFANKLLKMLEEPPAKTLFILITEKSEELLATILSRSQRVNFRPIDEASINLALQTNFHIEPNQSQQIAHLANGSYTKALQTISLDEENRKFFELFVNLMRLSYQRKIREMKLWSEQVAALGRERQKRLLIYCQRLIRENFIYNLQCNQLSYMNQDEKHFASRFAPFVNERNVMGIMDELSEAQQHIEQNVNAKMVFFDFSLKMIVLLKQ